MYRYYDDAEVMYSALPSQPANYIRMVTGIDDQTEEINQNYYMKMNSWYKSYDSFVFNDNRTMIRANALFLTVTFGSFYANSLLFLILGFSGCLMIFHALRTNHILKNNILFPMIMFYPSLCFWTGSITKEALTMFVLGGLILSVRFIVQNKFSLKYVVAFALFFFLMFFIKVYVIACMIPALIALLWLKKGKNFYSWILFGLSYVLFFAVLWNFHHIFPEFNFVETFVRKQHDFVHFAQSINAGSMIHASLIEPTLKGFLVALPNGLFNIFFRPLFFDSNNWLMLVLSIENLSFILILLFLIPFYTKIKKPDGLFWLCIFFSFSLLSVIGLSTPVTGALVRYKVIAFPFLFSIIISFLNTDKLVQFLKTYVNKHSLK